MLEYKRKGVMNLRHMEAFRAVMLTGGVGGAAELLHISQPAVSKLLAQARKHTGFPLFERVRGRLLPTPEGQELFTEIETLWRGVERVRDISRQLASPRQGTLKLGVSANFATHLVPRTLAERMTEMPELTSQMEILITPIMVDALQDRTIDLGVALQPIDHPNLVKIQGYRCGFSCAMRHDHPLAKKKSIKVTDLRSERIITSPSDSPYGKALQRVYGREAPSLQLRTQVRSSASACWMAQAGVGIAVVDSAAVAGGTFADLTIRPLVTSERLSVSILRNRYRPLSMVQKAFCSTFDAVWRKDIGHG